MPLIPLAVDLPPKGIAEFRSSEVLRERVPLRGHASAGFEPGSHFFNEFEFGHRVVPMDGGRTLLRFHKKPTLRISDEDGSIEVIGWGIRVPISESATLPRHFARRFLQLWGGAENQSLTEEDRTTWEFVVDAVDFDAFTVDRAAPRYAEGKFLRRIPNRGVMVEWIDGSREELPQRFTGLFSILNPDEWFSAFIKFGSDGKLIHLERLMMVSDFDKPLPDEWPTKFSQEEAEESMGT